MIVQLAKRPTAAKVTAKQHLLNGLLESRDRVNFAIRGLLGTGVESPLVPGAWSVREIVLHLCHWDYSIREAVDSTVRDVPPRWEKHGPEEDARMNAAGLERFRGVPWADAIELLRRGRRSLLVALDRVPAEPAVLWTGEHVFGRMLLDVPPHERHHAEKILRWRAEQGL